MTLNNEEALGSQVNPTLPRKDIEESMTQQQQQQQDLFDPADHVTEAELDASPKDWGKIWDDSAQMEFNVPMYPGKIVGEFITDKPQTFRESGPQDRSAWFKATVTTEEQAGQFMCTIGTVFQAAIHYSTLEGAPKFWLGPHMYQAFTMQKDAVIAKADELGHFPNLEEMAIKAGIPVVLDFQEYPKLDGSGMARSLNRIETPGETDSL